MRGKHKIRYLKTSEQGPWTYTIQAFERTLDESGIEPIDNQPHGLIRLVARALAKTRLIRNFRKSNSVSYLAPLMGPAEYRLFPINYFSNVIAYCYDCWPHRYDRWEAFFLRNKIGLAFFSARESAGYFARKIPRMTSVWAPEATDPNEYDGGKPLQSRGIDVLEMGRKYDDYHRRITDRLKQRGRVHLYEKKEGRLIFPTREKLAQGLGDSRISICFPRSVTHPERAGGLETVTHRYFESIASRCIIVGRCPDELVDLFGYNPVIEADLNDPCQQIEDILNRVGELEEVTDRNYSRLLEVGTWRLRVKSMIEIIEHRR